MRFVKLHGAGNDYIYVDARDDQDREWSEVARRVSDRHFGIGADGLILLRQSAIAAARMQMFNADGSEGMMCGNGIRCFIRFGLDINALVRRDESFDIETASGVLNVRPTWDRDVMVRAAVDMGEPILKPSEIPIDAPDDLEPVLEYPLMVDSEELAISCVSMGNPHAVLILEEPVDNYHLTTVGPKVEHHPFFPDRANFEVVNVIQRDRIRVRVWERGSGITLACGTGACASVVAARLRGLVDDEVVVELPGGELVVSWPGGVGAVSLEGPVERVFEGNWPD